MQHTIPVESLGPQGEAMAAAVDQCVHCGFCLATCPTYRLLGEEMDSPRGRIYLMKGVLEGELELDAALEYVDRCLGCLACVTSCPSGVEYGELLGPFREMAEQQRSRDAMSQVRRKLVTETLPYPGRFRLAYTAGKWTRPLHGLTPGPLRDMLDLLPPSLPKAEPLPDLVPAQGKRRARVALLTGCVQQVLDPEINWATVRVLAANGVEVVIPQNQGCCGALSMHVGEGDQARSLAQHNFDVFPDDVDAVISNAAGCGSGMHEYPLLFKGHPGEGEAVAFAAKVKDISVFLDELGLIEPPSLAEPVIMAYHDACHLAHAQGITAEPRRLLAAIGNLTVVEVPEGELCCGSAGTYNLEQPELANQLGERKARNILSTGAQAVVMGNIGCMTQIQTHLERLGQPLPVLHTVEVLDMAYRGKLKIED